MKKLNKGQRIKFEELKAFAKWHQSEYGSPAYVDDNDVTWIMSLDCVYMNAAAIRISGSDWRGKRQDTVYPDQLTALYRAVIKGNPDEWKEFQTLLNQE
jgi:hypothetical protein